MERNAIDRKQREARWLAVGAAVLVLAAIVIQLTSAAPTVTKHGSISVVPKAGGSIEALCGAPLVVGDIDMSTVSSEVVVITSEYRRLLRRGVDENHEGAGRWHLDRFGGRRRGGFLSSGRLGLSRSAQQRTPVGSTMESIEVTHG